MCPKRPATDRGRRVPLTIAVQTPDVQQAEQNLHHRCGEVVHHNDDQGEEATARREEERRLSEEVEPGAGGNVEEGRVDLGLSEKVGGQVGTEDENEAQKCFTREEEERCY